MKKRVKVTLSLFLVPLLIWWRSHPPKMPYADQITQLKLGMTMEQVEAMLGRGPDVIKSPPQWVQDKSSKKETLLIYRDYHHWAYPKLYLSFANNQLDGVVADTKPYVLNDNYTVFSFGQLSKEDRADYLANEQETLTENFLSKEDMAFLKQGQTISWQMHPDLWLVFTDQWQISGLADVDSEHRLIPVKP